MEYIFFFLYSRLLHLLFGPDRHNNGHLNGRKRNVRGEQTITARSDAVSSFRLPGVLGNRNKRTKQ